MHESGGVLAAAAVDGVRRALCEPASDLLLLDVNAPQLPYRAALALVRGYRYVHACGALDAALVGTPARSGGELARYLLRTAAAATRLAERIAPLPRALAGELLALALELGLDAAAVVAQLSDAGARVRIGDDDDAAAASDDGRRTVAVAAVDVDDSAAAAFYDAFGDSLQQQLIERSDSAVSKAIVAHCASLPLARRAVADAISVASAVLRDASRRRQFVRAL